MINIGSNAGSVCGVRGCGTAKAALVPWTVELARQLAERGGTANTVAPGLAAALASPQARHITGQVLHVNGGAYLGR